MSEKNSNFALAFATYGRRSSGGSPVRHKPTLTHPQ